MMKKKPNLVTENVMTPYLFGDFHTAHPPLTERLKQLEQVVSSTQMEELRVGTKVDANNIMILVYNKSFNTIME